MDELKEGFDKVFGSGRVQLLKHEDCALGSDILEYLDFMAVTGCTHLFLDHITLLTSEGFNDLTGNEATDKAMNILNRMVKRRNVWLGLISHIRKMGDAGKSFEDGIIPTLDDIKGSGAIKQICYDILGFARNLNAEKAEARNTIRLAVLKSRYTGLTGPAGKAKYDYATGRLNHTAGKNELTVEDDGLVVEI
jgi:twinkle protein